MPPGTERFLDNDTMSAETFRTLTLTELLDRLLLPLKEQAAKPLKLLCRITGTVLLSAAALALAPQKEWQEPLERVCVLAMFAFSLKPALELAASVADCVMQWRNYLVSFVPAFSGVLVSCGQPGQAAVYSGMFLMMAAFSAQIIAQLAVPSLQAYIALNTAGGLCGIDGLSDGCALLAKSIRWVLGLLSVLFSTVLGLQSALAQAADGLALRTGRFLVSSSLPVVGGLASEAMGSVLSGLKVVKGALGFAAVAFLTVDFLPLLAQGLGFYAAYCLGGALSRAFGLKRAGTVLAGLGQAAGLCTSFLVFFFMLAVISTALMILMGGG